MASKFFFSSSFVIFLLFSLSSMHNLCHANHSPRTKKLSSPINFFKNLNGTHKGDRAKGLSGLKKYLAHLGYLQQRSKTPLSRNDNFFDDTLESAIKKYQKFYNLRVTGILDRETLELLSRPRCGVPDFHSHMSLSSFLHNITNTSSFYAIIPGVRWPHGVTVLNYSFPSDFREDAYEPIFNAMFTLTMATPFQFDFTNDFANANVKISFERGDHGDGQPFYGPTKPLGHSLPPPGGIIHFNGDVDWWTNGPPRLGSYDLQSQALHQLGHVLGLGHSSVRAAVMNAGLAPGQLRRELHYDDIRGIQTLYPEY